jgi:predicted transporter
MTIVGLVFLTIAMIFGTLAAWKSVRPTGLASQIQTRTWFIVCGIFAAVAFVLIVLDQLLGW